MCGLAGEVRWGGGGDREAVAAMVGGIAHRGPDDRGLWSSADGACVLGHARLAIIDLSPAGHQPMVDPETGNVLVFNGEIYNFQALRRTCVAAGDTFTSSSDTEVILALYRRHGLDCLGLLRGMFAFALWDARAERLILARDRVGKKPLAYAPTPDGVAFCSELRPLARHPGVDRAMDLDALDLYLQCQFIPAPWTIYRGVRKLPAGHYAICDRAGVHVRRYWELDYRHKLELDEGEALEALEAKLTEAVRLRMIADVPLGALLSGGVDSSLVVALMAKLAGAPVRTFSIGFHHEAFDELPWAQQAADRWGTTHHAEVLDGDVHDLLFTLARHYGEPFADSSAVPSFLVSATARRHVTVALNGDGGDELLGGYPRYWLSELALVTSAAARRWLTPTQLAALSSRLQAARTVPMRLVRKLLTQYTHPILRSVSMFAEFWNDDARAALLPSVTRTVLPAWRREALEGAFAHADLAIDRMLWLDTHTYLAGDLLVKMDIASMHCGLETRSPLLDHEVIELCARLPVHLKIKDGVGKYLLKRLAERYYPAEFVHRPKRGFAIPLAAWLRGPLRDLLGRTLGDAALMTPLAPAVIRRTLEEFDHGHDEHASRLWALLMFGCWRHEEARP